MELGHLSRRGFVAKSLGALGGVALFAGFGRGAKASSCSVSCSSRSYKCHRHHCCEPKCCEPVTCCAPPPTCCQPQPSCCCPPPSCCGPHGGHVETYEAAPPPESESPPPPNGAFRDRVRYSKRYAKRSRYTVLSMLER